MTRSKTLLGGLAAAAVLAAAASATAGDGATTLTVQPKTTLQAGATAPFDAPGVRAIRAGRPIPAGYALVGREVTIQRGSEFAGAWVRLTCPAGKRLRTLGQTGSVAPQPGGASYLGKPAAMVAVDHDRRVAQPTGIVYGVCR